MRAGGPNERPARSKESAAAAGWWDSGSCRVPVYPVSREAALRQRWSAADAAWRAALVPPSARRLVALDSHGIVSISRGQSETLGLTLGPLGSLIEARAPGRAFD